MNMKKEEITQGKGDDSYKLLFQENKRRKNINLIQLIIGIVLVVIGSLIFMLQLSVELPVLSVGLGLWLIIHYKNNNNVLENAINFPPKKYKLKESIESVSFLSFNLLTIIIVLIPFILGIVNALIFGLEGE
ncbi:MAG: hypothetical protein GY870_10320, partial [archaeon]|nr:hypothetical protein [archaeon]